MTWKEPLSHYFADETLTRIGLTDTHTPKVSMCEPWSDVALYIIRVAPKTDIVFAERTIPYFAMTSSPHATETKLHSLTGEPTKAIGRERIDRYLGILPRIDTTGRLPFLGVGGLTEHEEWKQNLKRTLTKRNRTPWYALDEKMNTLLDSVGVAPTENPTVLQPRGESPNLEELIEGKLPLYDELSWHSYTQALPFGRVDGRYHQHPTEQITIAYGARTIIHSHNGDTPRTERAYYAGLLSNEQTIKETLDQLFTKNNKASKEFIFDIQLLALLCRHFPPDTSKEAIARAINNNVD